MTKLAVLGAKCNNCLRELGKSEALRQAVIHNKSILCIHCRSPLEIVLGYYCMYHLENLNKGYCDLCSKEELMDNQV